MNKSGTWRVDVTVGFDWSCSGFGPLGLLWIWLGLPYQGLEYVPHVQLKQFMLGHVGC